MGWNSEMWRKKKILVQVIKKYFEDEHYGCKIYWISSAMLWNSTTVNTLLTGGITCCIMMLLHLFLHKIGWYWSLKLLSLLDTLTPELFVMLQCALAYNLKWLAPKVTQVRLVYYSWFWSRNLVIVDFFNCWKSHVTQVRSKSTNAKKLT